MCKLSRIIGTPQGEKEKPVTPKRHGVNKFYYNAVKRRNGTKIGKLSDITRKPAKTPKNGQKRGVTPQVSKRRTIRGIIYRRKPLRVVPFSRPISQPFARIVLICPCTWVSCTVGFRGSPTRQYRPIVEISRLFSRVGFWFGFRIGFYPTRNGKQNARQSNTICGTNGPLQGKRTGNNPFRYSGGTV